MCEIISDLWIYKYKEIKGITNVYLIDCFNDLNFLTNEPSRRKYELVTLYKYIIDKISIIDSKLKNNKTVIVACKTCKQLSPLLVACYLVKYGNMEIMDALMCIKSKKNNVFEEKVMFSNILDKIYSDNK